MKKVLVVVMVLVAVALLALYPRDTSGGHAPVWSQAAQWVATAMTDTELADGAVVLPLESPLDDGVKNAVEAQAAPKAVMATSARETSLEEALMVAAYRDAVHSDPQAAEQIKQALMDLGRRNPPLTRTDTLNATGASTGIWTETGDLPGSSGGDDRPVVDSEGGDVPVADADEDVAEENVAEEVPVDEEPAPEREEPPQETYWWCTGARPAPQPGVFRCPCPGDAGFSPQWRKSYSAAFLAAQGCGY